VNVHTAIPRGAEPLVQSRVWSSRKYPAAYLRLFVGGTHEIGPFATKLTTRDEIEIVFFSPEAAELLAGVLRRAADTIDAIVWVEEEA